MKEMNRRQFIASTSVLAATSFVPWYSTIAVENDIPRLRMGAIGVGGQGSGNMADLSKHADFVALCDVAPDYLMNSVANSKRYGCKANGKYIPPDCYGDYRRVLERDDIDAVLIATPDHWHVKIAIEALQAGKHVYCQKPLTLTLEENLLVRKAAEKYKKTFQVGAQRRTQVNEFALAALIVRGGYLGKIHRVTCVLRPGRKSGTLRKYPMRFNIDWNMFVGQAPMVDYIASSEGPGTLWKGRAGALPDESNGVLTFRWWHNFAGGIFTDWGAHYVDAALWATQRETIGAGPVSVDASGSTFLVPYKEGKPLVDNIYNTVVGYRATCKYKDGFELIVASEGPDGDGVLFEGEKGRIHVNCGRIRGKLISEGIKDQFKKEDYIPLYNGKPVESHWANFARCCHEGGMPISDVASHVQAMHVCHLCGISSRIDRPIQWDSTNEKIIGDDLAASFFSYKQRKGFELPTL